MCWKKISEWLKPVPIKPVPKLTIPHPEEAQDNSGELVDLEHVRDVWMIVWHVKASSPMKTVELVFDPNSPYPAYTIGRKIVFQPSWANPGVLMHEICHISWSLLTDKQQTQFGILHDQLKGTDPYMKLLYSINTYGLTNHIEGHAEIGRYLGQFMPEILKPFYPCLYDSEGGQSH